MPGHAPLTLMAAVNTPPKVLFSDDFNRANENLESSLSWTRESGSAGDVTIASNVLSQNTSNSTGALFSLPAPPSADCWVEARNLTTSDNVGFICCRLQDTDNFVGLRRGADGALNIFKKVGGTFAGLGTGAAISVGDIVRLEVEGSEARGYINGTLALRGDLTTGVAGTLSTVLGYGLIGRLATANPWIDNFRAGRLRAP